MQRPDMDITNQILEMIKESVLINLLRLIKADPCLIPKQKSIK